MTPHNLFLVSLSIGEPPVSQLLAMDTGSPLTWVNYKPCSGCHPSSATTSLFDPLKSTTYNPLSCDSSYCDLSIEGKCDLRKQCEYTIRYLVETSNAGDLATEKLSFGTSDDGLTSISSVVIGCGHKFIGGLQLDGILKLGFSKVSLVSNISKKISYCTGDITDPNYIYNKLILGDGTQIEGDSTPMEIYGSNYYVTLETISVGDKVLAMDKNIFKRTSDRGGVVIDSGTTYMQLKRGAFEALKVEVENYINGKLEKFYYKDYLCYEGKVNPDLQGFHMVKLHLAGGVEVVLDIGSMFQQLGNEIFCMAVELTKDDNIIGMMAQQHYNVAYDLTTMKIHFLRTDYELLDN
ncbi:unnamed protein product [Ilex paraguariensis]|uniref:Peptidase A1 domain-containing protein n=1 Tax=Ilex paraguariensis TaxID=185542 RepID=A0ABC8ST04_9AQUA